MKSKHRDRISSFSNTRNFELYTTPSEPEDTTQGQPKQKVADEDRAGSRASNRTKSPGTADKPKRKQSSVSDVSASSGKPELPRKRKQVLVIGSENIETSLDESDSYTWAHKTAGLQAKSGHLIDFYRRKRDNEATQCAIKPKAAKVVAKTKNRFD